jgi:hypothetical protein
MLSKNLLSKNPGNEFANGFFNSHVFIYELKKFVRPATPTQRGPRNTSQHTVSSLLQLSAGLVLSELALWPKKEGYQARQTPETPQDSAGTVASGPSAGKPLAWKGLPFVHQSTAPTTACKGGPVAMRAKVGQRSHRTDNPRPADRPPRPRQDVIHDLHRVVRLRMILTDFERSKCRANALIRQGPPIRLDQTKGGFR